MPVQLILASASPRRVELLSQTGLTFRVSPSPLPEPARKPAGMPIEVWPAALAFYKARAVQQALGESQATILGADTIVVLERRILNKPRHRTHARSMLTRLAGRRHLVITGLALLKGDASRFSRSIATCSMKRLSPRQIERYLDTGLWRGKAGGYGIQDDDSLVTLLSGEPSNVAGLPLQLLAAELQALWLSEGA